MKKDDISMKKAFTLNISVVVDPVDDFLKISLRDTTTH